MTAPMKSPKHAQRRTPRARAEPRPYHHGNLPAALLDAADGLLAERGAKGLTLRDVAKAAGVSHAAPYHHFASLNDLLAAIAERGFMILGDAMATAVAVTDTRERMLRVSQAYVDCARAHPERFRLMFGPMLASKEEHPGLKSAAHRAFGFVLAAAQAHDSQHGASLALAGWSLAHGLSHLIIDGAFDGLPMKRQNLDTLARKLSERIVGAR
jgi:AcrR family transcriptional regulator